MDEICATKYGSHYEIPHSQLPQCYKIIGITFAYRNSLEKHTSALNVDLKGSPSRWPTKFFLIVQGVIPSHRDQKMLKRIYGRLDQPLSMLYKTAIRDSGGKKLISSLNCRVLGAQASGSSLSKGKPSSRKTTPSYRE